MTKNTLKVLVSMVIRIFAKFSKIIMFGEIREVAQIVDPGLRDTALHYK